MAGSKRQKELARAKYERQQARRSQAAQVRKRRNRIVAIVVVAVLVVGALVWVAASRTSDNSADLVASSPTPAATSEAATPSASTSASSTDPAQAEAAVLDCGPAGTPRADDLTYTAAPAADGAAPTSITLATNCGDIVIALDAAAPKTVASEAFLAKEGFYDNTACHRLTTSGIFVLQCGDPKGDGTGGPGYSVPDENLPTADGINYPAGTVAMANAGPGTSGSQFFIVYDDTTLPAGYSIWGHVTSGLDMVKEVASVGVADGSGDGAPRQPVFIESATVQP